MTPTLLITLGVALGWLVLACLLPRVKEPHRQRGLWALIGVGVPILGWLTLNWGPMAGVLGFAVGLAILFHPPKRHGGGGALPPLG
ncbi:DUF2484 family protein [Paracoccus homiensis]|uniref:DUF2484 family protein n=1 Tax=Paracoccus homiensis TaxID=364199 RepID=A0A1I0E9Q3_9RHOB|nr:DUF2484 family protein [Paracoccus homiensis]SET41151.1 Protein of unknown function [Paracoccus homiensis]